VSRQRWTRVHLWLTVAWALALVPTVLWWQDSVLWVAVTSIYGNVATHWGAWQAARAEEKR
jgi:hypothetical protein